MATSSRRWKMEGATDRNQTPHCVAFTPYWQTTEPCDLKALGCRTDFRLLELFLEAWSEQRATSCSCFWGDPELYQGPLLISRCLLPTLFFGVVHYPCSVFPPLITLCCLISLIKLLYAVSQLICELNMSSGLYIFSPMVLTWFYYWALQQTHSHLTVNITPQF